MKTVLLVGSVGCGKTTFRQQLQSEPISYAKTQSIEAINGVIDTPGEYLELGRYKRALMLASYDADAVVLIQSAVCTESRFPPGFASSFPSLVIGVVSKIDLASSEQVADAVAMLTLAGAQHVFTVDSVSGHGFDAVREVLCTTTSS